MESLIEQLHKYEVLLKKLSELPEDSHYKYKQKYIEQIIINLQREIAEKNKSVFI